MNELQVAQATIIWDDRISQVVRMYGSILIDYAHYLFEERFIVGFDSGRGRC
ncbi:MAG TPA: hypothetical protein PKI62_03005 [bacterium]|nr:hypothetical protein [bacterium]HPR88124.1 hypothetical protein [bacterium]